MTTFLATGYGLLATGYTASFLASVCLAIEGVGWLITVIAVTGVVLNNHRRRACFVVWMVSNTLSAVVHVAAGAAGTAGMYPLAVRDVIFFVLAIHGLVCWGKPKESADSIWKPRIGK